MLSAEQSIIARRFRKYADDFLKPARDVYALGTAAGKLLIRCNELGLLPMLETLPAWCEWASGNDNFPPVESSSTLVPCPLNVFVAMAGNNRVKVSLNNDGTADAIGHVLGGELPAMFPDISQSVEQAMITMHAHYAEACNTLADLLTLPNVMADQMRSPTSQCKKAYDHFASWGNLSLDIEASAVVPEIKTMSLSRSIADATRSVHRAAYQAAALRHELAVCNAGGTTIDIDLLTGISERLRERIGEAKIAYATVEAELIQAQQRDKGSLITYAGTEYRTAHGAALDYAHTVSMATGVTAEQIELPKDDLWRLIARKVLDVPTPNAKGIVEAMKAEAVIASQKKQIPPQHNEITLPAGDPRKDDKSALMGVGEKVRTYCESQDTYNNLITIIVAGGSVSGERDAFWTLFNSGKLSKATSSTSAAVANNTWYIANVKPYFPTKKGGK